MLFSWSDLVRAAAITPIQFPKLRVVYLAQSIVESGRGTSFLFQNAGNPNGMKWRSEMQGFAEWISTVTPTEPGGAEWCLWRNPEDAVHGYWRFISRPVYSGWERFGDNPMGYLQHIWQAGYATDSDYVQKISSCFAEAESLLNNVGGSPMANWILFARAADGFPIVSAMSNTTPVESRSNLSKADLIAFLQRFDGASTFLLAPNSGQLPVEVTAALDRVNLSRNATWYQFFRESTGKPAVVAMENGNPVDILRSNLKNNLIAFLNKYPGANTFHIATTGTALEVPQPGSFDAAIKPVVEWVSGCPNFSSRNGAASTSVVVHYTTSRNINGTISWFKNPISQVSAHYIIGRDGRIVQMVRDSDKAWHCSGFNANSIGIEHVAAPGDQLTPEQEKASAALIKWLIAEYNIPAANIFGHRWNPSTPDQTSCPGSLWPSVSNLEAWIRNNVLS